MFVLFDRSGFVVTHGLRVEHITYRSEFLLSPFVLLLFVQTCFVKKKDIYLLLIEFPYLKHINSLFN